MASMSNNRAIQEDERVAHELGALGACLGRAAPTQKGVDGDLPMRKVWICSPAPRSRAFIPATGVSEIAT